MSSKKKPPSVILSGEKFPFTKMSTLKLDRIAERVLKTRHEQIEVRFVRSPQMRKLNFQFRKKNKATDILSFSSKIRGLLGSLVIDVDTARKQAKTYKHSLAREIQELFVHGLFHLLGYDHIRAKDARIMKRQEMRLMPFLDRLSKQAKKRIRKADE